MIGAPTVEGYEILAELGHGGMGVVYKARQTGLNRTVAVKMILSREPTTANEIARFLAEAEAVAAIRHPNVVQVYESGTAGGLPFFAMMLWIAVWAVPRALRSGWGLGPVAIFAHSAVDYPIQRIPAALVMFIMLAAIAGNTGGADELA